MQRFVPVYPASVCRPCNSSTAARHAYEPPAPASVYPPPLCGPVSASARTIQQYHLTRFLVIQPSLETRCNQRITPAEPAQVSLCLTRPPRADRAVITTIVHHPCFDNTLNPFDRSIFALVTLPPVFLWPNASTTFSALLYVVIIPGERIQRGIISREGKRKGVVLFF